jgi:hypothetical protein
MTVTWRRCCTWGWRRNPRFTLANTRPRAGSVGRPGLRCPAISAPIIARPAFCPAAHRAAGPPPRRSSLPRNGYGHAARGSPRHDQDPVTRLQQQSGVPAGQAPASVLKPGTQRPRERTMPAGGAAPGFSHPSGRDQPRHSDTALSIGHERRRMGSYRAHAARTRLGAGPGRPPGAALPPRHDRRDPLPGPGRHPVAGDAR